MEEKKGCLNCVKTVFPEKKSIEKTNLKFISYMIYRDNGN